MDKTYFIELTNKLYKLSFFFPEKEPLRHKIREVGGEILADLVLVLEGEMEKRRESAFGVERNIEILDALLELSKSQNWIDSEKTAKIQEKYREIKSEVKEFNDILRRKTLLYEEKALLIGEDRSRKHGKEETIKPAKVKRVEEKALKINKRQEKILQLLEKQEKMQVKDFQGVLSSTTKRTLRRDLSALAEKRIVKRFGSGNTTYYMKRTE